MIEKINKQPKVRFKEFAGENAEAWEQHKFAEEVEFFNGLTYSPDDVCENGTFVLRSSNVKEGEIVNADNVYVNPQVVNSANVEEGDIIVVVRNGSRALIGKHAQIKKKMDATVIGAFMTGIRSNQPGFVNALLDTEQFNREIHKNLGATINQITNGMFAKMNFMFPNFEEQLKIGAFFRTLDNLIALHQRELDNTKTLKQTMLSKMFPKDGAEVPEVRFAGFTEAWEQRKFGDLAQVRRGLTYKPSNVQENGVKVLRSSNIDEDIFVHREDDVYVEEGAVNIDFLCDGDILITAANGSSRLVGKHAIINGISDRSTVHGGFMLAAKADNPEFLNASMSSRWYSEFINMNVAGGNGAIGNLKKNDLENYKILVPNIKEQEKIGDFFAKLEMIIALHQRELETYQRLKKTMLEKMFV